MALWVLVALFFGTYFVVQCDKPASFPSQENLASQIRKRVGLWGGFHLGRTSRNCGRHEVRALALRQGGKTGGGCAAHTPAAQACAKRRTALRSTSLGPAERSESTYPGVKPVGTRRGVAHSGSRRALIPNRNTAHRRNTGRGERRCLRIRRVAFRVIHHLTRALAKPPKSSAPV